MDIINTKIEDILKFPFREKDWFSTFGIYIIVNLLAGIMVSISFLFIFFGGAFALEGANIGIFLAIPFLIFLAIFFIITLYLQGYVLEIVKSVKEEKTDKPKHDEIGIKLRKGFDWFLLSLGPIGISILIFALSVGALIWGISLLEATPILATVLIIVGILKTLFSILTIIAVSTIIIPSMLYIYLQTNSVKKGYDFKNIWLIVKNMWKEFLVVYAISIVLTMIISALGQMPCIGFLVLIVGTAYTTFVIAFLIGKIFVEIDKLKLLK